MSASVPRTRRKYSDTQRANALAVLSANRGNVLRTSRELNIPERTLNDWSHLAENAMNPNSKRPVSSEYALEIAQLREEKVADLSNVFESVARKYLSHASDESVVMQTRGRDAVFSAAIATDKMQLLRNQPTSITEHVNSDNLTIILQAVLNEITSSNSDEVHTSSPTSSINDSRLENSLITR
jgi:transposase-like protein